MGSEMCIRDRVPADARLAVTHGKGPESTQFDAVAAFKRATDLVKDGANQPFNITVIQSRVSCRQSGDEFRTCHGPTHCNLRKNVLRACPLEKRRSTILPVEAAGFAVLAVNRNEMASGGEACSRKKGRIGTCCTDSPRYLTSGLVLVA